MPGPLHLTRTQLLKHKPNKSPLTHFIHRDDGVTEIHVVQKTGRHHIFTIESKVYFGLFNRPEEISFCASPQTAKNPHDRWYCKVSFNGVTEYLHRILIGHECTPEQPQIDHRDRNTNSYVRSNLHAVSSKENLANRTIPDKKESNQSKELNQ